MKPFAEQLKAFKAILKATLKLLIDPIACTSLPFFSLGIVSMIPLTQRASSV
jgi:hypothetical protein